MAMIEEAAAYGGDNQVDARLALILIYNREKRYDDALKQLATMREQFPRNRLLWLETGSIAMRLAIGWAGTAGDPPLTDAQRTATERMYAELRRGQRRAAIHDAPADDPPAPMAPPAAPPAAS